MPSVSTATDATVSLSAFAVFAGVTGVAGIAAAATAAGEAVAGASGAATTGASCVDGGATMRGATVGCRACVETDGAGRARGRRRSGAPAGGRRGRGLVAAGDHARGHRALAQGVRGLRRGRRDGGQRDGLARAVGAVRRAVPVDAEQRPEPEHGAGDQGAQEPSGSAAK